MPKLYLNEEERKTINKILVIQTAFIGDVILITPFIRASSELFPNAIVDVIVTPQTSNILTNNPHINSIILFEKRKNKYLSFLKVLNKIKSRKYDIAFTPHSSLTTALFLYFAKIPIRVGFDRWLAKRLLTHKIQHTQNVHKIEKILHLLSPFSEEKFSIQTELFPTEEMEQNAKNILSAIEFNTKKKIAVAPGSNWFTKRWPKEYYIQLVKILSELNYGIIFIGSKEEKILCDDIRPQVNSINMSGKLSLLESAAIIKNCDLMICNDSGAMHIANAVKTDVISFFGPTVKKIGYFPYRENDQVLEIDMDCRPCSSHGGNDCPLKHHNCMKFITPEFVLNEIVKKFSEM